MHSSVLICRVVKVYGLKWRIASVMQKLSDAEKSEIIEMALSDHISFSEIKTLYGLNDDAVKKLMRTNLKQGSYKAWRRRVRDFSDRRANYK